MGEVSCESFPHFFGVFVDFFIKICFDSNLFDYLVFRCVPVGTCYIVRGTGAAHHVSVWAHVFLPLQEIICRN